MKPRFICVWLPYVNKTLWGAGRRLYKAGYKKTRTSRGLAWGFGHPSFLLDRDDNDVFISTCTRCGAVDKL